MSQRSVVVKRDPSGLYTPGAMFTMLDLASGVQQGTWPIGMEFTVKGAMARMIGKVLIREDGCILDAGRNGRAYKWREWEPPQPVAEAGGGGVDKI